VDFKLKCYKIFICMNILLVEDDETTRFIIKKLLEKNLYQITVAIDGEDAMAKLEKDTNFNLILTDIMMPKMNGIKLLEAVKAHPILKSIPVIGFTQGNLEHMKAKTTQCFDALIPKPIEGYNLIASIKSLSLKN